MFLNQKKNMDIDDEIDVEGSDFIDNEYVGTVDVDKFIALLREAWHIVKDVPFSEMLSQVFNGYNLSELTPEEQEHLLNEFILHNM